MVRSAAVGWQWRESRGVILGTLAGTTQYRKRKCMMDNTRFFLYVALSFVMFLLWQAWRDDYGPRPEPAAVSETTDASRAQNDLPAQAPAADLPSIPQATTPNLPGVGPTVGIAQALPSIQRVSVHTDVLSIELDTYGGDIRRLELLEYPLQKNNPDIPFPLLSDSLPALAVVQGGLLAEGDSAPNHHATWRAEQDHYVLEDGADELRVPLYYEDNRGIRVTKTFVFRRDDYEIGVEYQIENGSGAPWRAAPYTQIQRTETPPIEPSWFVYTFLGAAVHDGEAYRKIPFEDIVAGQLAEEHAGGWAAMVQHYFVTAAIPAVEVDNHFYTMLLDGARYVIGVREPSVLVDAGASATITTRVYSGPKLQDRLASVAPGLERTVDYGWLTFLAEPLFWLLDKIHSVTGNWGWAIIFLTILIKLAFFKLSETSYRSMANMRRVQPRMKAIQERYKEDKQRLQQAMMDLYKQEKINPLGGCLPILVQIPVFIALYWVLLESVELRQAPWALWLTDLSSRDPYFILPVLMGASMLLQQKLNPAAMDPVQQKVMTMLPIVFTVFFAFFPSGLVLYWFVNNVISLAQQYYITRKLEA